MCGRYQLELTDLQTFKSRFQIDGKIPDSKLKTSYNITPGQDLPVVVSHSPNSIEIMQWGFVPVWEEKKSKPNSLINIRSEKAISAGWAKHAMQFQRCLIPASGFYEWKKTEKGKIPYRIFEKDQNYFSFAGLYSTYKHPETGHETNTYAILTTTPNKLMEKIHFRMPAILTQDEEADWLNPDTVEIEHLAKLLHPYRGTLDAYPVSTKVNSPANNDPSLIEPKK